MDKRTLFFVISLSLTLFLVNSFFDYQRMESKKIELEQQTAKNKLKIQKLETEIKERTLDAKNLPLVALYSDSAMTHFVAGAVAVENHLLTLASSESLPAEVYAKQNNQTVKYTLTPQAAAEEEAPIVLYHTGEATPLKVGNLSDFGQYQVQLVTFHNDTPDHPFSTTVGDYTDGHFEVPAQELHTLIEKDPEMKGTRPKTPYTPSIVLVKTDNTYLPVAIYTEDNQKLDFLKEHKSLATTVVKPSKSAILAEGKKAPENYYVLQNSYQQLVFSNVGGSLVELNLPFETESNTKSAVREIAFDRDMVANHPYNASFPVHSYNTPGSAPEGPFQEHDKGSLGGYYPLLRRDLIETGGRKSVKVPPRYYAFNIVSEYPEMAEIVYDVKYFDNTKIVFESHQDRRRITKTYTLSDDAGPYVATLKIDVEGDSRGLWLTSGVPEVELISGSPAPALKYRLTRGDTSEVKLIELPTDSSTESMIQPDWLANSNGFFGIIVDPLTEVNPGYRAQYVSGIAVPSRLVEIDQQHDRFKAKDLPGYELLTPLKSKGGTMEFRIFAGPLSTPILKAVDSLYSDSATGYNPDYVGAQTFHGWFAFISEPFAKFLFLLLNFFHSITGSWAFSIVLLTVALRVMLYPLNAWSTKSMLRTQEIMPKVQEAQKKYKNDPKQAQIEVLKVYKEAGVNPISGMTGGCFPLLIQMPFLIGMFDLLKSSPQLRGASFIPGWIDDLAAPDVLFSWNFSIPFIGTEFHLLPIILGLIMFFQPRMMSPLPKDPTQWTEQQRQQRTMSTVMAVMFTWLFYNFPSGLNIYWISSMLMGMVQQWYNKNQIATASAKAELKESEVKTGKGKLKTSNDKSKL